jgi:hypothetical protein
MDITITRIVTIKYVVEGFEDYGFGTDNKFYNLKRSTEIKQVLNNSTKGYWIKKKFFSLDKLRPLLIRPNNFGVPF